MQKISDAVRRETLWVACWTVGLCLVMHLGVSEARAQGAITERPKDYKAAIKMMRERLAEQAKENNNG